jgi:hypothetical protein
MAAIVIHKTACRHKSATNLFARYPHKRQASMNGKQKRGACLFKDVLVGPIILILIFSIFGAPIEVRGILHSDGPHLSKPHHGIVGRHVSS